MLRWATSEFGGFVAAKGGRLLGAPAARHRQIEFIGDSYTAGYGNMSDTRDCTGEQVNRTTNAELSFGALTADRFGADYQINAFSGRGGLCWPWTVTCGRNAAGIRRSW